MVLHRRLQNPSGMSETQTAKAMKAANQKSIVRASTTSRMIGLASFGTKRGIATRNASAKRVKMACQQKNHVSASLVLDRVITGVEVGSLTVNKKKLTRLGESEKASTTDPAR